MTVREKISVYAVIAVVITVIVSSSVGVVMMPAYASKSVVGNYANGYDLGKENGRDDYREYYQHNSTCPPNDSLSWCTGYKIGYEVGWAASAALGGN
jgi:hypothetical protein